ncbi:hypothetical protein [Emcibacter nanhaiensis]|uniref:PEP-CTERM sorting domain-containing protein n=1 Tax=Emcibacter nanhaiensis TaxID=1505037 RepID=A0A501PC45_9PROT|nr:hypothetical protein [Emcibacter nanhaiensis]TPD57546.1 hypothetical protein FIV46_15645 [Emcibacter nanhaiensis]
MFKKYFALLTLVAGLGPVSAYAAPLYNVQWLDAENLGNSWGDSINDQGAVSGYANVGPGTKTAAYWDADGTRHDITSQGDELNYARLINNNNQIVGFSRYTNEDNSISSVPFYWDSESGVINLPQFAQDRYSVRNLGPNGEIVVYDYDTERPGVWTKESGFTYLPDPEDTTDYFYPIGFADNGEMIFQHWYKNDEGFDVLQYLIWNSDTGYRDSGFSDSFGDYYLIPDDLTDDGTIFGSTEDWSEDYPRPQNLFRWTEEGELVILPVDGVDVAAISEANNNGQALAYSYNWTEDYDAVDWTYYLWDNDELFEISTLIDPNDPYFGLFTPDGGLDLNNLGQMTGQAYNPDTGKYSAFILNPILADRVSVPAPGALGLLICGAGLLLYRRKRS